MAALFLSACDSDETRISDDEQARLLELVETNKALWESRGVEDYTLEYDNRRSFCHGDDEYYSLIVEVIDSEVDETFLHYNGGEIQETNEVGQPSRVSATPNSYTDLTFDKFFGYPRSYYVRPNKEELGPQCYGWWTHVTKFY
jgi:hypothetical protein